MTDNNELDIYTMVLYEGRKEKLNALQEIRQEIDTLASDNNVVIYNLAIQDVQEIIDKHIKEVE